MLLDLGILSFDWANPLLSQNDSFHWVLIVSGLGFRVVYCQKGLLVFRFVGLWGHWVF